MTKTNPCFQLRETDLDQLCGQLQTLFHLQRQMHPGEHFHQQQQYWVPGDSPDMESVQGLLFIPFYWN